MTQNRSPLTGAVLVIGLFAAAVTCIMFMARSREIHTNVLTQNVTYPSYSLPAHAPVLHVLFLGDSYTFVNDLPHMIATVAASDTAAPVRIETGMYARGNFTLDQLWNDQGARMVLLSRHWDYVVLQEHSMQTLHPEWVTIMERAMADWNSAILRVGARPVVYETWARKPGSDWYDQKKYPGAGFGDPEYMQGQIDSVTNRIARSINAPVVPVGDYWAACRALAGMPDLYYADATHPSLAGDYLTALLLYRGLTGHKTDHVAYSPEAVGDSGVALLKRCASY